MRFPRPAHSRQLTFMVLLVGLTFPALAQASQGATSTDAICGVPADSTPQPRQTRPTTDSLRDSPTDLVDNDEPLPYPAFVIDAVTYLNQLTVTMFFSWYYVQSNGPPAPVDSPAPLVVKPPVKMEAPNPPTDNIIPTSTKTTPEPGSMLSGIIGGTLAVMGWLRHRRLKQGNASAEELDSEGEQHPE